MKLSSGIAKLTNSDLLVTPRYERWIRTRNAGDPYSGKTVAVAHDILSKPSRDRGGHFSASGLHTCPRAQVYNVLGFPTNAVPFDTMTYGVFNNGHYAHLRWQLALIEAGILTDVEHFFINEEYNLRGTIDGMNEDEGWGWEFKTIHTHGFNAVRTQPKHEHLLQVHAYMMMTGFDTWSVIYEDKNTQDYREFVVHKDSEITQELLLSLIDMNGHVRTANLPIRLKGCQEKGMAAYQAQRCKFSHICLEDR